MEKAVSNPRRKKHLKCRNFSWSFQTKYKLENVKEVLEKYVMEYEVEQLMHQCLVKTAFVHVKHEGFNRSIGLKMFNAPDRFARIKGLSQIPASEFTLKCQNCQELGHLKFGCKKE